MTRDKRIESQKRQLQEAEARGQTKRAEKIRRALAAKGIAPQSEPKGQNPTTATATPPPKPAVPAVSPPITPAPVAKAPPPAVPPPSVAPAQTPANQVTAATPPVDDSPREKTGVKATRHPAHDPKPAPTTTLTPTEQYQRDLKKAQRDLEKAQKDLTSLGADHEQDLKQAKDSQIKYVNRSAEAAKKAAAALKDGDLKKAEEYKEQAEEYVEKSAKYKAKYDELQANGSDPRERDRIEKRIEKAAERVAEVQKAVPSPVPPTTRTPSAPLPAATSPAAVYEVAKQSPPPSVTSSGASSTATTTTYTSPTTQVAPIVDRLTGLDYQFPAAIPKPDWKNATTAEREKYIRLYRQRLEDDAEQIKRLDEHDSVVARTETITRVGKDFSQGCAAGLQYGLAGCPVVGGMNASEGFAWQKAKEGVGQIAGKKYESAVDDFRFLTDTYRGNVPSMLDSIIDRVVGSSKNR